MVAELKVPRGIFKGEGADPGIMRERLEEYLENMEDTFL